MKKRIIIKRKKGIGKIDKMDGQSNQVTACLVSTEPRVCDNTSDIQHKVGDSYALCIRLMYSNRMIRMLNEIVLAIEVWLLVLFRNDNGFLQGVGVFTAAVKVLQKQTEKV